MKPWNANSSTFCTYTCLRVNIPLRASLLTPTFILLSMPGRAKSDVEKHLAAKRIHDAWMAQAVTAYHKEQKKTPKKSRRGLRTICKEFEDLYFSQTGKTIKLCHMTLKRLAEGGKTREKANANRRWLTDSEEDVVIDFISEMADRGFPLSHRRLKEHVDTICKARLGKNFPAKGVGENWTYQFAQRNSERIKISRSRPLEDKRGRGANPHTNAAWWKLLGETIKKYDIKPHNIYGTDEVGIQAQGGGEREHVFGAREKAAPYQQRGGTRENITVIVTICADGTSTPPAVIFKGSAYQVKWGDNNPLNASYSDIT